MRLRNIPGADEVVESCPLVIKEPAQYQGKWNTLFDNNQPIHIEIGMGKGKFIMEMARLHPEINYVGIERYTSVLLRAIQKLPDSTQDDYPKNLLFICMDATEITSVFAKGEIDKIYLNFSDPWPKDRHAKRRLPSKEFLKRYEAVLAQDGSIEFKTDNRGLFDFAVEEVSQSAFKIDALSYDLHHEADMMQGNVMTEYEEKFSAKGNPICKYILTIK